MKSCRFRKVFSLVWAFYALTTIAPPDLFSFTLSGDWLYQTSKDKPSNTSSRYSADIVKSVPLSPIMQLSASMHLSRNQDNFSTTNSYTPSLTYNISNYLFDLNLNGTANKIENSENPGTMTTSLYANWRSKWFTGGVVPSLAVFANYTKNTDDLSDHLNDNDYQTVGSSMAWEFNLFSLSYNNSFTKSVDNISLLENSAKNHNAQFSTGHTFWQDRATASFSQSVSYNENETSTIQSSNGISLIPTTIIQTYYDEVDPALNLTLPVEAGGRLHNRDKNDPAVIVNNPADPLRMNIAVRLNFHKVDLIYLYTQNILGPEKTEFTSWNIYSSNDNLNWTLRQTLNSAPYNLASKRFEFAIKQIQTDYLKVVAMTHPLATAVTFSEIEVYEKVANGDTIKLVKRDNTSYASNFGLNLELMDDLRFSSSASYQKNTASNDISSERKNISTNLGWNPGQYFSSGLSANISYQTNNNGLDTENRSYGIRCSLPALPTLETSFGFSINEYFEDSLKQNSSYNTSVDLDAELYRDLHATMHNSYNVTKNNETDETSNTVSSSLSLLARLLPKIYADSTLSYAKSKGSRSSENFLLNVHWRPSDILSTSATYNQSWSTSNSSRYSLSATCAITEKIQLGIARSATLQPVSTNTNSVDFIWDINEVFTLVNTGSYHEDINGNSWSTSIRLTARYSTF